MPFKPGEGRPAFNITESEIRYAMENSKSCAEAARFLKISYEAFRKYAKLYKDEATGNTLFEFDLKYRFAGAGGQWTTDLSHKGYKFKIYEAFWTTFTGVPIGRWS